MTASSSPIHSARQRVVGSPLARNSSRSHDQPDEQQRGDRCLFDVEALEDVQGDRRGEQRHDCAPGPSLALVQASREQQQQHADDDGQRRGGTYVGAGHDLGEVLDAAAEFRRQRAGDVDDADDERSGMLRAAVASGGPAAARLGRHLRRRTGLGTGRTVAAASGPGGSGPAACPWYDQRRWRRRVRERRRCRTACRHGPCRSAARRWTAVLLASSSASHAAGSVHRPLRVRTGTGACGSATQDQAHCFGTGGL